MSKENILKNIKKNKPSLISLMDIPIFENGSGGVISRFEKVARSVGIQFISPDKRKNIEQSIKDYFPKKSTIIDLTNPSTILSSKILEPDVLIINGQYGVAENAAIWVDENNFQHRILPFITQILVLVLEKKNLVKNMHQAYQKIKIDKTGFGVFIAGPSKTADIEQSLVIGAQGAREMFVVLV